MVQPVVGSIAVTYRDASWTHNLDAWLIQVGTRSRFNHAAIVSHIENYDKITVIEAAGGGVRERVLTDEELPRWRFESWHWITLPQRQAITTEARKQIGVPYDYLDILKFVRRFWTGKVEGHTRDYSDGKLICSELVSWCLHKAGINPWPKIAFGAVSPGDIAEWIFDVENTLDSVSVPR